MDKSCNYLWRRFWWVNIFPDSQMNLMRWARSQSRAYRVQIGKLALSLTLFISFSTGLFKQQDLMKPSPGSRTEIYIRQVTTNTYRHILKEIRQKEIYKLIIDLNPKHMNKFFRAVSQNHHSFFHHHGDG